MGKSVALYLTGEQAQALEQFITLSVEDCLHYSNDMPRNVLSEVIDIQAQLQGMIRNS
jgi:hypothetical protein